MNVAASRVTDLRKRRIARPADLARRLVSTTYVIVDADELDAVDEWRAAALLAACQCGRQCGPASTAAIRKCSWCESMPRPTGSGLAGPEP